MIVGGRTIVKEGHVTGIDYPAMREDLLARFRAGIVEQCRACGGAAGAGKGDRGELRRRHPLLLRRVRCRSPRFIAFPRTVPTMRAASRARSSDGRIDPRGVIAVFGKTEGNGCVNDFSRGFATMTLTQFFSQFMPREEAEKICFVMSGGTEGAMAPHWTVFERATARGVGPALAIGRAHTARLPPEHLGRAGQIALVADGVRAAMRDAGIADPADVHFVQIKCPLLTAQRIGEATARGKTVATSSTLKSMGLSRAASALGVAVALGELQADAIADRDIGDELVAAFRPRQLFGRHRIAGP